MTNIYFLVMTGLDSYINQYISVMIVPLSFVIIVSMIKDIFEDLKRHSSDKMENNKKVLAGDPKTGKFQNCLW